MVVKKPDDCLLAVQYIADSDNSGALQLFGGLGADAVDDADISVHDEGL